MTPKQHKRRHQTLHRCLDELFADFITHSERKSGFTKAPIAELLAWAHKQATEPDHEEITHGESDGV